MFDFGIKITIEPVQNALIKPMVEKREQFVRGVLSEGAKILVGLIQFFAPKDTGAYAMSWRIVQISGNQAIVGSEEDMLFAVLEFGVDREITVTVHEADSLHWTGGKYGPGDHFAKYVKLPPRPPKPHVSKAIKEFKKIFRDLIFAHQGETIPAFRESTRKHRQNVDSFKKQYKINS